MVTVVLIVVIIMVFEFLTARHPGVVSEPAAECRAAYRLAHSATDTAIVDAQTISQGRAGIAIALSCGALRRTGELH
jgi:hypothetical protein